MTLVVDDTQLVRLAVEPPRDAARILRRTTAFRPLVMFLAVVPSSLWATWQGMSSESAAWSLRACAVQHAGQFGDWLVPGSAWPECRLIDAPPLAAWLTAMLLPWGTPGSTTATVIISCAAVMLSVALFWFWVREMVGERIALLATAALALHPTLLQTAASAGPDALTFLFLLVTVWGYWGHLQQNEGWISLRILCAGIGWGLATLSGGGIAWGLLVALLTWGITARGTPTLYASTSGGRVTLRTIGLLFLTGAAISLWWPFMMWRDRGAEFLVNWLELRDPWARPAALDGAWGGAWACLSGWGVLGTWNVFRTSLTASVTPTVRWSRWLMIWTGCGIASYLLWQAYEAGEAAARRWELFLLPPLAILVAKGLDRTLRRETSRLSIAIAITISLSMVAWRWSGSPGVGLAIGGTVLSAVLLSAPLAVGLRRTHVAWSESEIRRWILLAAAITVLGHAAEGLLPLLLHPSDRSTWEHLTVRFSAAGPMDQVAIIANDDADLLPWLFVARANWPQARLSHHAQWDPAITATLINEVGRPQSRIAVIEWNRSGFRFRTDLGTGWRIDPWIEPMAFRGRRLAMNRIVPSATPPHVPAQAAQTVHSVEFAGRGQ